MEKTYFVNLDIHGLRAVAFTVTAKNKAGAVLEAIRRICNEIGELSVKEMPERKQHGDRWCTKYNEPVLPNEEGNCSLCGAKLVNIN